jgi:hypothetical protein
MSPASCNARESSTRSGVVDSSGIPRSVSRKPAGPLRSVDCERHAEGARPDAFDRCFRSQASVRGACPGAVALDESGQPRPRTRTRLLSRRNAAVSGPKRVSARVRP